MMPPTGMPQGMGMPMMSYTQRTQFTYTGIAGLDGGYAYAPGSGMCQFLDNLNGTMANASMLGKMGPGGQQPGMGGQKPGGGNMMLQMMGMMFGMLIAKLAPIIKQRLAERRGQGKSGTGHSGSTESHGNNKPPKTEKPKPSTQGGGND